MEIFFFQFSNNYYHLLLAQVHRSLALISHPGVEKRIGNNYFNSFYCAHEVILYLK